MKIRSKWLMLPLLHLVIPLTISPQVFYKEKSELFYRHCPTPEACVIDLAPLPSGPVDPDIIDVDDFSLEGSLLTFNLSWDLPERTNGKIQGYDVRITLDPLPEDQEDAGSDQRVFYRSFEVSRISNHILQKSNTFPLFLLSVQVTSHP